jgi:hypothetical protein
VAAQALSDEAEEVAEEATAAGEVAAGYAPKSRRVSLLRRRRQG